VSGSAHEQASFHSSITGWLCMESIILGAGDALPIAAFRRRLRYATLQTAPSEHSGERRPLAAVVRLASRACSRLRLVAAGRLGGRAYLIASSCRGDVFHMEQPPAPVFGKSAHRRCHRVGITARETIHAAALRDRRQAEAICSTRRRACRPRPLAVGRHIRQARAEAARPLRCRGRR
jgi:hypothetical protein